MDAPEPNDATPFLPERRTLAALREAVASRRGCPLWRPATQAVFGEGMKKARVMLVDEQRIAEREAFAADLAVVARALV